jgi:hypothetical protein
MADRIRHYVAGNLHEKSVSKKPNKIHNKLPESSLIARKNQTKQNEIVKW